MPVEKLGDSLLCMDQYYKTIGTCRVPNKLKDDMLVMQSYSIDLNKSNHVIVIYKNRVCFSKFCYIMILFFGLKMPV